MARRRTPSRSDQAAGSRWLPPSAAARSAPAGYLAEIPWRRVAAGVILAGMLGSVLDLILPGPASDPIEVALFDPLDAADGADIR